MTNYFGWQPSLLSMDLSSGSQWGSMNIHMNQAWADMQARSTLYMTPTTNWGGFCNYGMPSGGMDFLTDPRYTIAQFQWNQNAMNNGGCNWSNWGNWNNGFNWNNFGWNGGNTSGSSSSATTPEERQYQKKYNKLLSLVKQLASDDSKLPAARKDALDEIAKHPVGKNYEEKFKNLKAEYDRVSKNEIKKFLASKAAIRFGIDGKEAQEATSFYGKLQSVGYEFTNSKVDSEIAGLYDEISNIRSMQENYQLKSNILSDLAAGTGPYDILDVISSWNTQKKDSTVGDKRIIDLIKKGYDALPDGDAGKGARSSVKTNVISPIVNGLINRARGLSEKVDSASQAKITAAITNLENSYNNTNDKVDANMSKAFDELYLLTRKAAIAQLRTEINEYWGSIDSDIFGNNLFEEETKADLKAEGFDDTAISAATVVVPQAEDSGDFSRRVDETKPARQQLEAITGDDNALTKATSVSGIAGVTEAWIDNNTGKVYVLKTNSDGEDEIHELDNPIVDNDKKVTGGTVGKKANANDIATASAAAKQEAQDLKTEQEAVTALIQKGHILTKGGEQVTIEGKQYDVYIENKGDEREFVLIDGILYELKHGTKGDKVTAASIEAAYNSALEKEEQIEEINQKYHMNEDEISEANKIGLEMQDCLNGYTTDDDWKDFRKELDKVNVANVMHVIAGFNAAGVGLAVDSDRFFTQLMDEDPEKADLEDIKNTVIDFVKEYVNDNMVELDSRKQERVKKILAKLEDSSSSPETLDDAMDSLFTIFNIEDTISMSTGEQWATVGTMTAAGAGVAGLCSCWFSETNMAGKRIFKWFE